MHEIISKYYSEVPRGTIDKLIKYYELLKQWNNNINLVSPDELKNTDNFIRRHVIDSMQLYDHLEFKSPLSDIGSGAGFPGIVLAIMGIKVELYEIDQRKAIFLKEIIRKLELEAQVFNCDIKFAEKLNYYITARAFADLGKILQIIYPKLPEKYKIILPKGKNLELELNKALSNWQMDFKLYKSIINPESNIIIIEKVEKKIK